MRTLRSQTRLRTQTERLRILRSRTERLLTLRCRPNVYERCVRRPNNSRTQNEEFARTQTEPFANAAFANTFANADRTFVNAEFADRTFANAAFADRTFAFADRTIRSNSNGKFCISLFYRPSSSGTEVFESLSTVLQSQSPEVINSFVLIGDFNVDYFCTHSFLYKRLFDCLSPFLLCQIVPHATHESPNGTSTQSLRPYDKKRFWKAFKFLTKKTSSIPELSCDGSIASSGTEKASMLNTFFGKCFNHSQPPLDFSILDELHPMVECPEDFLCTVEEVEWLLNRLDTTKANGPDGISARMLKTVASSIAPSVTTLFNKSINSACFPCVETSECCPGSQIEQPCKPFNYRPISLLSTLSKVLEHHIHYVLSAHLQKDIDTLNNWVTTNHLSFNTSKCKYMLISRKKYPSHPPTMVIGSSTLERVYSYKYLGLRLTSTLCWSDHINNICIKAKKLIGMLYRRFYEHGFTKSVPTVPYFGEASYRIC